MVLMREVSYSNQFAESVADIVSEKLRMRLDGVLASIEALPGIGSPNVQKSLRDDYGPDIRKLPFPPFVIVYRCDSIRDLLEFVALPHGRNIA